MGPLRRLIDRGERPARPISTGDPRTSETPEAAERARDLELVREDQARLDDLARRQLRYADHAWQPPAQGGERRADDADADGESAGDGGV